ncbi:MAG: triose-phosphate isomerase, partial [Longimicrobiales bacterium]|nr:triose-phosphate isomerase [Longimicrobiales bacterium]
MPHRPVIAGNWKMHHGPGATRRFFEELAPRLDAAGEDGSPRVMIFPPALSFAAARESLGEGTPVELGVQNIHWEPSGAYTGELSASMAAEAGATLVLVGHSERRHVFGETDDEVARKVSSAVEQDLVPVICVGETLDQRKEDRVEEVITGQLEAALESLLDAAEAGEGGAAGGSLPELMVAYEPVWAIGTGETATPADASEAHETLRALLASLRGADLAESVPIL